MLYRKSYDGVLLQCLSDQEAEKVIQETHNGICGARATSQLIADHSTIELLRKNFLKEADFHSLDQPTYNRKEKKVGHFLFFTYTRRKGDDSNPLCLPGQRASRTGQGGGGQPSTLDMPIDQSIFASCQFAK